MKKRLKINGFIMFVAVMLVVIFPSLFFRQPVKAGLFDAIAEIFGIALILLGQLFRASARGFKAEHSGEGRLLIQTGPYSLVRNPMYLGILLIGLGVVLLLFQWWIMAVFAVVFIVRYILLIFNEEKKLLSIFPTEYKSYQATTPRLIPSFPALWRKDISEYLPVKPLWIKKEIGSMLAVLLIALFFESREDILKEGIGAYVNEAMWVLIMIGLFICLVFYLSKRTLTNGYNNSNKSKNNL